MAALLVRWLKTGAQLYDEDGNALLFFDTDMDESHEFTCRIADHVVERGVSVSDHISDEPNRLTINGLFTDTPTHIGDPEPDRARKLFNTLKQIKDDKEPFTVVTGLYVYDNMVIELISIPRNAQSGYAIEASVTFREIKIAEQLTVNIPEKLLKSNVKNKGQGTTDIGQQGTEEASEEQDDENASLLYGWGGSEIDFSSLAGFGS